MRKWIRIFLIVVLVINILAVDVFLYLLWNKKDSKVILENNYPSATPIPTKIQASPTPTTIPTPTTKIVVKNTMKKTKSIQYIPIPGSGSTLENKWTDLSGTEFYISTDDYPNLVGAYFEANMKLLNGNGLAYLRLFDVTAGIEVWGSEISTSSQSFTSVSSGKLTIRSGTHLYRVQAKSLTADMTVFNSGRIKVILEN